MNKYGTCLEQLMRKFDPLKQLWDHLEQLGCKLDALKQLLYP